MEQAEFVYLNGNLVDAKDAQISIYDIGITHGVGLFETMRLVKGKVFRLDDHISRLFNSAAKLQMNISQTPDEIRDAIASLCQANNLQNSNARMKLTITPGNIREVTEDSTPVNSIIISALADNVSRQGQIPDAMPVIITQYRINDDEPGAGHKTLNYFNRLHMLQQAHVQGYGEAICFSVRGFLCGGCLSNIFLVSGDKVITPALTNAIVPGITRKAVLDICKELEIETTEEEVKSQTLMNTQEIFLTNSSMGIVPVSNIGEHKLGDGKTGKVTQKIIAEYNKILSSL